MTFMNSSRYSNSGHRYFPKYSGNMEMRTLQKKQQPSLSIFPNNFFLRPILFWGKTLLPDIDFLAAFT